MGRLQSDLRVVLKEPCEIVEFASEAQMRFTPKNQDANGTLVVNITFHQKHWMIPWVSGNSVSQRKDETKQSENRKEIILRDGLPEAYEMCRTRSDIKDLANPAF